MCAKKIIWIVCAIGSVGLVGLRTQRLLNPSWEQPAMGTTCRVTLSGSISKKTLSALREKINTVFIDVNRQMSTWETETEISRFNASLSLAPFPISQEFSRVVRRALDYSKTTGGAFDPTVKPLVDYWGFGRKTIGGPIEEIQKSVGWKKVQLKNGALIKTNPRLQLDLSAIAKGHGVDRVATLLRENGRTNFLVEIGGEIVAEGNNPSGKSWRVGIESPEPGIAFGEKIFQTIELSGRAIATSGNYRNIQIRKDGTRFSHIIDPRTGKPVESNIGAVSVIANQCMNADAMATALFVMGVEKGLQWVETNQMIEALFIVHAPNGAFTFRRSTGF